MTSALRVIDLPMLVDLLQNPFHVSVVRLDDGCGERSIDLPQPEIDLIISSPADSYNLVFVAENGRVTDESGIGIPFVAVYFLNTTIGVSTDLDGNYSMETRDSTASLLCASLDFRRLGESRTAQ